MSIESAKAFLRRIKDDEELAKRLAECETDEEKIQIARSDGFDFTKQELKQAVKGLDKSEYDLITAGGLHVIDLKRWE